MVIDVIIEKNFSVFTISRKRSRIFGRIFALCKEKISASFAIKVPHGQLTEIDFKILNEKSVY